MAREWCLGQPDFIKIKARPQPLWQSFYFSSACLKPSHLCRFFKLDGWGGLGLLCACKQSALNFRVTKLQRFCECASQGFPPSPQGLEGTIEKHSPSLGRDAQYKKISRIARLPAYLTVQFVRFFVGKAPNSDEFVSKKILKVNIESFNSVPSTPSYITLPPLPHTHTHTCTCRTSSSQCI